MSYKCNFEALNFTLHGHLYFVYIHMCVQFQCQMFIYCSKNKYYFQTWNSKVIIVLKNKYGLPEIFEAVNLTIYGH